MKKLFCLTVCIFLFFLWTVPALAAPEGPEITLQPQSPNYPNTSVAIYTVKAQGSNLNATWYIQFQGQTYNASATGGAFQPWEAYAGEAYGPKKLDSNTFSFTFEGIEEELNGAYIWCVIEDGHYDVTSQKARICVGNPHTPPQILSIPGKLTVAQGGEATIRCVASAPEGQQLSYLWYETDTGRLEDIRAVNRGTETSDFLNCETATPGTRNYLCLVKTADGGETYSSYVAVTVTGAAQDMQITTESLPQATAGQPYEAAIRCNDPSAEFSVSYNPGKANDFEKTGLTLNADGVISGTAPAVGSYTFCICASGTSGEDYRVYTLTVVEESQQPATPEAPTKNQQETPTQPTQPAQPEDSAKTTGSDPAKDAGSEPSFPWAILIITAIVATAAGIGIAFLLVKK